MSTPNSRGGKSEGFSLYAPKRVSPSDGKPATGSQSGRMRQESQTRRRDDDWAEAGADWQAGPDEGEPDPGRDRLEQAIREVFELGRPLSDDEDDGYEDDRAAEAEGHEVAGAAPEEPHFEDQQDWDEPEPSELRHEESEGNSRLRSLYPDIVPEPPPEMLRTGAGRLVRFAMVVAIAALVAYGVTTLWTGGSRDAGIESRSDRIASNPSTAPPAVPRTPPVVPVPPPSRLVVADQQAFAGQPLAFPIRVDHPRQGQALVVSGLVGGTRLSAGTSTGASTWRLSPDKLRGLFLYAPKGFVGVMNTAVDLVGPDRQLLESRVVQLKWIPKQANPAAAAGPPPAATQPRAAAPPSAAAAPSPLLAPPPATAAPPPLLAPPRTAAAPAPLLAPPPTPAQPSAAAKVRTPAVMANPKDQAAVASPRSAATAVNSLDPGEVDFLMQQGRRALSGGDISAARVAFRRLADAGNAEATLALGETYDPAYLAQHDVIGLSGDRAAAKGWYERAKQLGSPEAGGMLARLGNN